ncbi:MAG: UDP-2,3-diacylglucosamine diphosphatase [Burkholderiaceae bacterium]
MPAHAALPDFGALVAPAAWQAIDFISDLHLAEDTPRGFEAWSQYLLGTTADAVFILGDLFEVWVGDDARAHGFEARCAAVLAEAAARRSISLLVGNRDFLVGPAMLTACGVTPLTDPTVLGAFGTQVLLTHGDELCVADTAYQVFRAQVRSQVWQSDFLARPLDERRSIARDMREQSEQRKRTQAIETWVDVDASNALDWMRAARTPTLIHGHTHRPGSELLAAGRVRHVLSDWELDHGPAPRAEVLRWQRSGFTRITPTAALAVAAG